jgi:hypothetical protein
MILRLVACIVGLGVLPCYDRIGKWGQQKGEEYVQ